MRKNTPARRRYSPFTWALVLAGLSGTIPTPTDARPLTYEAWCHEAVSSEVRPEYQAVLAIRSQAVKEGVPDDCVAIALYLDRTEALDLSNYGLERLEPGVNYAPKLKSLRLSHNRLTAAAFHNIYPALSQLESLQLDHNLIGNGLKLPRSDLRHLDISHNQLSTFEGLFSQHNLISLKADHNRLTSLKGLRGAIKVTSDEPPRLSLLSLSHNQLGSGSSTALSELRFASSLGYLNLSYNDLQTLDALKGGSFYGRHMKHSLFMLDLDHNRLSSLQVLQSFTKLTSLNLRSNLLTNLEDLADLPALIQLAIDDNPIDDLASPPSGLQVETLGAQGLKLTRLDLASWPQLEQVDLRRQELPTFTWLEELTYFLDAPAAKACPLPASHCPSPVENHSRIALYYRGPLEAHHQRVAAMGSGA